METYKMKYSCRNCGRLVAIEIKKGDDAPDWPSSICQANGKYLECSYCGGDRFYLVGRPKRR